MSNTLPYGDPDVFVPTILPVDLNTACIDDLCGVPGIGPTLAQRIIAFRAEHGPFSDASDLAMVPRIGPRIAARVSERVSIYGRLSTHGSDPALPLSLGTFGSPRPANVSVDEPAASLAPAKTVDAHATKVETKQIASQTELLTRLERRHRFGLAAACLLATVTGLVGGFLLTQTNDHGSVRQAAQVVQVTKVEAEHQEIHVQLDRQASAISSATAAVSKIAQRQAAFEAETHAEEARASKEVADLSDRTRKAQARTDAKVYNLTEATKLIDWATSGGYASKATASLP